MAGNFLTLFDISLNQLKQVPIQESNDRYFVATITKERLEWEKRGNGDDNFLIAVWPQMTKCQDYSPTPENVPHRYVGGSKSNAKSWLISCSFDQDEMKWKCDDYVQKSMHFENEYLDALTEYAPDRFAIWSSGNCVMLLVNNWHVVYALEDERSGNLSKTWVAPLPRFDLDTLPFVMCSGQECYSLVNVKTGKLFPLVKGSALNSRV